MAYCNCGFGAVCEKCEPLHREALEYAQRGGPAGCQELYYERLDHLKRIEECRKLLNLRKEDKLELIAVIPAPEVKSAKEKYYEILGEKPATLKEYEEWENRLAKARTAYDAERKEEK
jgi:hypothetical protein